MHAGESVVSCLSESLKGESLTGETGSEGVRVIMHD